MTWIGVRMYSKECVELFILAREEGFTIAEASRFAGVSLGCGQEWSRGTLPRSFLGNPSPLDKIKVTPKASRGTPPMKTEPESLYAPPQTGPLAGLAPSQIENLLLRAVLADLKVAGWDLVSISNKSKCELGERLRLATGLPLRLITSFLRISKSSYEYHRARLGHDKYAELRKEIEALFLENDARWGYRTIWAHLRRQGRRVSEKVVRRLMREEGLQVIYNRKRVRGWSSYEGEISKAPRNLVNRDFHAEHPNELWLTDMTEFKVGGKKVYLNAIIDCFDGKPVGFCAGTSPSIVVANSSLKAALAQKQDSVLTTIHSDRGGHYRWPEWISICAEHNLIRSMSKKACSPDNAAMEGFFGRLKNEFYYYKDWSSTTPEEFIAELYDYLEYYSERRLKCSLGWLSPNEYRRKLGYAA